MAKCKSCKTNIPEGAEYCEDCQDKVVVKANESYLDSLLNSVQNSPSAENIYKKKNNTNDNNDNPDKDIIQVQKNSKKSAKARQRKAPESTTELNEEDLYRVDFSDIEDFSRFPFEEDLNDIEQDIIIRDEDLFGVSLASLLGEEDGSKEEINVEAEVNKVVEDSYANEPQAQRYIEDEIAVTDSIADALLQMPNEEMSRDIDVSAVFQSEESAPEVLEALSLESEDLLETSITPDDNQPDNEYSELSENADLDLDLDELLNSLDTESLEAAVERNMANPDEDMFSLYGMDEFVEQFSNGSPNDKEEDGFEAFDTNQDDFLSLLGQVSDEDSAAEDIRAISDMLAGNSTPSRESGMPSNVGEVFSDALKAVSSLNDYELEEDAILGNIPDQEPKKKKAKKEKIKKEKLTKDETSEEKPKLSLFKRLFGNIKDDKSAAEFAKEQRDLTEPKAEKVKKAKGKKKAVDSGEDDEVSAEQKGAKDKAAKKAEKKEKAEKKKKTKEVIEVIDEIDEDPGRINRVGAGIVFCFFGIIAIILILGTNMVTYTLSIQHATNYFNHRKYTQAYNEVYGVDIRDEDIGLYDKIQTVMFVNKQLNSYNNYYALEQYPEALDSLLKGLSRYDKYIELATMLGIESDLDYVRSQILAELNNVFKLTEEEAIQILSHENMEDYSLEVYDVVLEKMNN